MMQAAIALDATCSPGSVVQVVDPDGTMLGRMQGNRPGFYHACLRMKQQHRLLVIGTAEINTEPVFLVLLGPQLGWLYTSEVEATR